MMILYPQYYRQHGIRRAVQLVAPTLSRMETLDLPQGSILHFVAQDESQYGMPQDDYLLRHVSRMMYVDHVKELGDNKGNPRPTRQPPNQMIRDYQRKYRRTRALTNIDALLRDPRTLVIENYALLPHLFRYTTSYFRNYYKWWNIQAAMWARVGELDVKADRQQYLECYLPTILPSLGQLRKGEAYTNRSTIAAFAQNESMFILEVWKWLGEHRETSVLAKAGPRNLSKMNLIWTQSDKWFIMNLGLLDQWRRPSETELKAGADPKHGIVDPQMMQKRFLRALMFLFESGTVAGGEAKAVAEATIVAPTADGTTKEPTGEVKAVDVPLKIAMPHPDDPNKTKLITIKPGLNIDNFPDHPVEETADNMRLIDEAITKDLDALAHLHLDQVEDELTGEDGEPPVDVPQAMINYVAEQRTLESAIMAKADALVDDGLLSGAEYRRLMAVSSAYKKIPDPYGSGQTLEVQAQIDVQNLVISDAPSIPDSVSIVDKSMLKTSLAHFDTKYVNEVMPKDITNMVLGIQHGGVGVTGYQIEHIEDALNSYTSHTVNLVPVTGKPSTIRFRLPKVEDDGTFRAGGVRYRLRKQRGDMPIRKLSPEKVALTSYYAKIFVSRSDKQVHNYPGWLTNQIAARGMDPTNEDVDHLMVSDVFKREYRTPRLYSILAARFRSFELPKYDMQFFLDYAARYKQFGEERVKAAEKSGMTVIGRSGGYSRSGGKDAYSLILVDQNDVLYQTNFDNDEEIAVRGTMESLLELDRRKAPAEVAVLKVFNKLVPVGMFLAYQMGLSRLFEVLGVNPRRVPSGERVNLSDDEYVLKFQDEQLVFPKEHRLAALILAGIGTYENATSNYPVHLFDRKDIYLNVLDQAGVGARYLREMDLMVEMFVDPITRELLEDMHEPLDFIGLVIRACELLQTDWSPDETDMAFMRIKGYERMAGAVYSELVNAVRGHRARSSSNASIELSPYAVWTAVAQDSSVKLVEDSNPVHNLKEREELTYSGTGGRSARSMVSATRVYHPNDMGVISEATKDSADVAITTFTTADPNLKNLRGVTGRYEKGNLGPASLLSTSALLAPAATRDD
jgi:hypothetical protein